MSEFKFSCPNCNQNIQATSEYSGLQINCPSCQTLLVVPADPNAPAPAAHKLGMAASAPHPQAAAGAAAASTMYKPVLKKKSKAGLIAGLSVGACAVAATIYFWPTLMEKLNHHDQVAAIAEAATNTPPPPPELTTEEILEKVGETYKGLNDYAAKAKTDCQIDMSALVPGKAQVNMSTTSSLQLGRTNNYRLDWEQNAAGKITKGAVWCAGRGNYFGYGATAPIKVKTREEALADAASTGLVISGVIAGLFFADTNSFATDAKDLTRTNSPSPNGKPSYVLTGEANHQNAVVWIDKSTFLISQIQITLGGAIPEEELKKLPTAERNAAATMSKLKGTITESYDNIQTNQNLLASAFESAYAPNPNSTQDTPRRKGPNSMAGQMGKRQRGGQ